MKAIYRPYEIDDHPAYVRMVSEFHKEEDGRTLSLEDIEATIREFQLSPEKGCIFVFEIDGQIVGYGITVVFWCNQYGGNVIVVDEFFVLPHLRNRGIGSGFIEFLTIHPPHPAVAISLELHPSNKKAAHLYQKMGFEVSEYILLIKPIS